jgi:serine/threonine-protein kinase ATR
MADKDDPAKRSLDTIGRKVDGRMTVGLPLSVEGQVDDLIQQATNPKLLFEMYIGWSAYL